MIRLIYIVLFLLTLNSCDSIIGGDINEDPNNAIDVSIINQLPSIQINLADIYGGEFSRVNCAIVQQVEGVARPWSVFYTYSGMTPNRFNTVWENVYTKILNEINYAQSNPENDLFLLHKGILNVLEAYTLILATDVWDNIPYKESFLGITNTHPQYDSQSELYEKIKSLLEEARNNLNSSSSLAVNEEDVYHQGDIQKWLKACNAIEARMQMRLKNYNEALRLASLSFDSLDDNLSFKYPGGESSAPWYRFNRDRTGDIELNPTVRNLMRSYNDTLRLEVIERPFFTNHPYLTADQNQELITYREMQFIIAEADYRINNGLTDIGYNAYLSGIEASFQRFGLSNSSYEQFIDSPEVNPGINNINLQQILEQKYIALIFDPECFSDWRRTSWPSIIPVSGSEIPVRWPYPQSEYDLNENTPTEINIFLDRVGWNR